MYRKLIYLVSIVLVLGLVGSVSQTSLAGGDWMMVPGPQLLTQVVPATTAQLMEIQNG